jgi:hypothetical protein
MAVRTRCQHMGAVQRVAVCACRAGRNCSTPRSSCGEQAGERTATPRAAPDHRCIADPVDASAVQEQPSASSSRPMVMAARGPRA